MTNKTKTLSLGLALLLLLGLLLVNSAQAQEGDGYDLTWWTVDGGGGTISGDGFSLSGSVGQPEGGAVLTGDGYTLTSGFWGSTGATQYKIYLPLVLR